MKGGGVKDNFKESDDRHYMYIYRSNVDFEDDGAHFGARLRWDVIGWFDKLQFYFPENIFKYLNMVQ